MCKKSSSFRSGFRTRLRRYTFRSADAFGQKNSNSRRALDFLTKKKKMCAFHLPRACFVLYGIYNDLHPIIVPFS
jgi:hypothetical protein